VVGACGVPAGVAVSLLANIAAAPVLAWQSVLVAGWPPVALLLAVELLAVHRVRAATEDQPVSAGQPDGADGKGDSGRVLSVRAAVQRLLETSDAALTSSEIVTALRGFQGSTSERRFRAQCM
jgi:hypothetical protein